MIRENGRRCLERRLHLVAQVIERRRSTLAQERIAVALDEPMPRDGFLIVIWPDSGMHDECARDSTDGFFDVEELPGHDSWVTYVTGSTERIAKHGLDLFSCLVAWIPEAFRDRWERAKQESVFDNFDALPIGASAAEVLASAQKAAGAFGASWPTSDES